MTGEPYLFHHMLERSARARGSARAVVHGEADLTYRDFLAAAEKLAGRLVAAGLQPGDRVGIFLPKSLAECVAIFAVSRAGGVFVPINASLKAAQVRHIVTDCGARVLVTSEELEGELRGPLEDVASLTAILHPEPFGVQAAPPSPATPFAPSRALGEDLAAILYTSGSTGRPKGVMLSHRNLLAGTRIVRTYLEIGPEDRLLSVLPFSFDYGLNQLLTTVEQGARLVLLNFRLGDEIVRAITAHEITGLAGVPTIWAMLTRAAPSLSKSTLPSLRYITNSGGAVPSQTVRALREKLPTTKIFLMYGLTEAFRSTYLPPDEIDKRPTSIGKAIPECEVFALTPEGRRAKPGEKGILVHRGPTVSLGYWNRPEETARVLRPNPLREPDQGRDMVCWSGDIVVQDDDGFFYFVGRDDAMIKSAGFRISPTEVEEALMAEGAFQQVAVIGLPDEIVGQKPHAIAVSNGAVGNANGASNGHSTDPGDVLRSVAKTLPAYMLPARIELVDALPKTPNGKVDYKRLVAERT